jgi:hypothetical protein
MDGTTKNATSPFSLFGDKLKIIEVTLLYSGV